MRLRGASEAEVLFAIAIAEWREAMRGKKQARHVFPFDDVSPINQKTYAFKTVECVFAEEADCVVVVTVKVYYGQLKDVEK